ncbi:MAG TPA: alpha-amylase family glycosyl hydrolase [Acidimicrobiales bacterium]|nr:alpha-amylase family glycosyl hydrolase [Acidimicrobiales bacterium]
MGDDVTDGAWWSEAVGYEVYVRSFADGNADGIGDLPGLTSRLDHLADLGVDLVWVTPFYPSPMADFGYDVAHYCDVDPRFGTLDDFDRLVEGVHRRGMRLLIDLVPNHTSDQHEWFRSARKGPDSPDRNRYIWRDPAPDGGPPNNWRSHFGGPAWTLDERSGQYFCHLFLPEQPDLNWAEPAVHESFHDIIRFWLDRGADGFRIDVAHSLVKHPSFADNPVLVEVPEGASPRQAFQALRHDHDLDQPGTLDIYREWHRITGPRDAVLLGEVYLDSAEAVGAYVADGVLDLSFFFPVLHTTWDVESLRGVVAATLAHGRGRFCWVHSSHDDARAPTRFGGGQAGRRRALAFLAFTAFLPGPLFLYQGDELGLEDGLVDLAAATDPVAVRNADPSDGRDPVRTPMPWRPGAPNLGFSDGTPWLPVGANHTDADTVEAQRADPSSHLHAVRRLLQLRRERRPLGGPVDWLDDAFGPDVLAYRRDGLLVALNVGTGSATVVVHPPASVAYAAGEVDLRGGHLALGPDAVAVVDDAGSDGAPTGGSR